MSAFLALMTTVCIGVTVDLAVAPDQPLPHVYTDDPLIVELQSDQDIEAIVTLDVTPDYVGDPVRLDVGAVPLRARSTYWKVVDGMPAERGRYTLDLSVSAGGEAFASRTVCCRIDRPLDGFALPVTVDVSKADSRLLLALRGACIHNARLDAGAPDFAERVAEMVEKGLTPVASLGASADVASLAAAGGSVGKWEVGPLVDDEQAGVAVNALHAAGVRAPVFAVVGDAATAAALLKRGLGSEIDGFVLQGRWPGWDELVQLRRETERAGYEGTRLAVRIESDPVVPPEEGPRLAQQVILGQAMGLADTSISDALVMQGEFGPGFVYLSALAHRLGTAAYVGNLRVEGAAKVQVFRDKDQWLLVVTCPGDAADCAVAVGEATEIAVYDGRNNPLAAPTPAEGVITVRALDIPTFVVGKGGSVLNDAARTAVETIAGGILANEESVKLLTSDVCDLVKKFDKDNIGKYTRLDFLNLLRCFPHIEARWHDGEIPRYVAVPATASLARLARALCTLEHERGEAYVEPLQNTLANCGQFQSQYLTSSAGTSDKRERPDWISHEVDRLMDEAERLNGDGRGIEACAVAAVAEWRSRALEIAAQAKPLGQPENWTPPEPATEQPEPEPEPEPEPAKPATTKKGKK